MEISIDSNSLTYLIQASEPDYDPLNDEETNYREKVSMLRIFLYGGLNCGILPQVFKEINDIYLNSWKNLHESTTGILFHEIVIDDTEKLINKKKNEFLKDHPKDKDCRLLAEAEIAKIDVLLTRDHKFRNRLNDTSSVEIIFPSDFLKTMNFKTGDMPKFFPHETNPLFYKEWWRI